MIRHLRGTVQEIAPEHVVIDVGGIGYRVFLPVSMRERLRVGSEAMVHTHLHVREDEMTLYGFLGMEGLRLFESLLGVSGVGPRVALGVVSAVSPADFYKAVFFEDVRSLTRIPGIGRKTAHRILLEMRDRLGAELPGDGVVSGVPDEPEQEAIEALVNLGYDRAQASRSVKGVCEEGLSAEGLLKAALKAIAKMGGPGGGKTNE